MKTKSYVAKRAFSRDRWALCGESAYYVDALYSPGGDFIAVGNTLISRMIQADHTGRQDRLSAYSHFADQLLRGMFRHYLGLFHRNYRLMGTSGCHAAEGDLGHGDLFRVQRLTVSQRPVLQPGFPSDDPGGEPATGGTAEADDRPIRARRNQREVVHGFLY